MGDKTVRLEIPKEQIGRFMQVVADGWVKQKDTIPRLLQLLQKKKNEKKSRR